MASPGPRRDDAAMPSVSTLSPFHLALPVDDLAAARRFYGEVLGCPEGRSSERWIDFDLFGHQLVVHLVATSTPRDAGDNPVDGDHVPVPHFGVVLDWDAWEPFVARLREHGVEFVLEPRTRFEGLPGEQRTMFFRDPAGHALEFKSFLDPAQLFAR